MLTILIEDGREAPWNSSNKYFSWLLILNNFLDHEHTARTRMPQCTVYKYCICIRYRGSTVYRIQVGKRKEGGGVSVSDTREKNNVPSWVDWRRGGGVSVSHTGDLHSTVSRWVDWRSGGVSVSDTGDLQSTVSRWVDWRSGGGGICIRYRVPTLYRIKVGRLNEGGDIYIYNLCFYYCYKSVYSVFV